MLNDIKERCLQHYSPRCLKIYCRPHSTSGDINRPLIGANNDYCVCLPGGFVMREGKVGEVGNRRRKTGKVASNATSVVGLLITQCSVYQVEHVGLAHPRIAGTTVSARTVFSLATIISPRLVEPWRYRVVATFWPGAITIFSNFEEG